MQNAININEALKIDATLLTDIISIEQLNIDTWVANTLPCIKTMVIIKLAVTENINDKTASLKLIFLILKLEILLYLKWIENLTKSWIIHKIFNLYLKNEIHTKMKIIVIKPKLNVNVST